MSHLLFVGDADSVARFFFPLEAVPVFYLKLPGDCYESGSPKVEGSITRTTGCSNRKSTAPPTPTSRLQKPRKLTYTYYEAFLLGGGSCNCLKSPPSLPTFYPCVRAPIFPPAALSPAVLLLSAHPRASILPPSSFLLPRPAVPPRRVCPRAPPKTAVNQLFSRPSPPAPLLIELLEAEALVLR